MSSSNFIGSETELRSVDTVGSPLQWCPAGRWWCGHCAGRNISSFLLLKQLPVYKVQSDKIPHLC
jgi:hypothetical protein